jgi:F-type H+-transporting ATPase subunit delta
MTSRSAGKRYASALFDIVSKKGEAQRTARDLAAVRALVAGSADLRQVLTAASVPPAKKQAIVAAVLKAAGDVSPDAARAVQLLAERGRIELLADLSEAFSEKVREAEGIVPADIVTAVPLSDAQRAALEAAIAKASGMTVKMDARVDPAIVGGVIARVGSVVFDGSVTRQLERLKQRLLESQ